jgi:murein DD-endopeptidase MepM/ murein hydrolase activator NlpD
MRILVLVVAFVSLLLNSVSAQAAEAQPPGHKAGNYVRWYYPSQMAYGPIENGAGNTGEAPARNAFLTLPFMGPHYVTAIFDHCGANYVVKGSLCRYDGVVASANVGGPDPTFTEGYAQTPGGHDYLYYDGHDGYDYGLWYEPVAAAAPGTVRFADWLDPWCHTCLSGLTIEMTHGNGLLTFYGHLSQIFVAKGQKVQRGQVIGISGSTGSATGPHLHFGVYYANRSQSPVDPYGWSGSGADPWSIDVGDLWLTGSPRYADVPLPKVSVTAVVDANDPSAIDVSWSSPGGGNSFYGQVAGEDGTLKEWFGGSGAGSAAFHGRAGETYWFWVSVTTNLGWTDAGGTEAIRIPNKDHGQRL